VHTHVINSGFFDCNTHQTADKREKMNNRMAFPDRKRKRRGNSEYDSAVNAFTSSFLAVSEDSSLFFFPGLNETFPESRTTG